MGKRGFIFIIGLCLLALCFFTYRSLSAPRNIFSEIYRDEYAGFHSWQGYPHLSKVAGINNWDRAEARDEFAQMPSEHYREAALSQPITEAGYSFNFYKKNEHMTMYFTYKLDQEVSLYFHSLYKEKNKSLTQTVSVIIPDGTRRKYIKNKADIQSYLDRYQVSSSDLETYYNQGMKNLLLKDWVSVYQSRFSSDDWGEVKVIRKW
ncbi:TipC family immunity protein [Streptococcus ferus]|uniref:Signal peptide n=1 Tax=Streptococcus ferus TaxID=1345 RepID=A0A2X3VZQ3_9STRE|nr:TipC family immunity protein [Streptococcus ferus]SQF40539.1 signal peptide [Streptococcus ferus]